MFKRAFCLFFFFLISLSVASYELLIRPDLETAASYQKLTAESKDLCSQKALEKEPARQMRKNVQKDIYTVAGSERRHFRLRSEGSELILTQKKEKIDAVEKLERLECWIQDEIDPKKNLQEVRYFTSDSGIYYFPSNRFLTDSIDLAFFHLAGSDFPDSFIDAAPYLTGVATEVQFTATDKIPKFTANHLRARFDPTSALP